jgi:hypothetical protein
LGAADAGDRLVVPLAGNLLECAGRCERILQTYFAAADARPDTEFKRAMIVAIAAMRAASSPGILEGRIRADALRLVVATATRGRDLLRTQGIDRELMLCAHSCDRAAQPCAAALSSRQASP